MQLKHLREKALPWLESLGYEVEVVRDKESPADYVARKAGEEVPVKLMKARLKEREGFIYFITGTLNKKVRAKREKLGVTWLYAYEGLFGWNKFELTKAAVLAGIIEPLDRRHYE